MSSHIQIKRIAEGLLVWGVPSCIILGACVGFSEDYFDKTQWLLCMISGQLLRLEMRTTEGRS